MSALSSSPGRDFTSVLGEVYSSPLALCDCSFPGFGPSLSLQWMHKSVARAIGGLAISRTPKREGNHCFNAEPTGTCKCCLGGHRVLYLLVQHSRDDRRNRLENRVSYLRWYNNDRLKQYARNIGDIGHAILALDCSVGHSPYLCCSCRHQSV